MGTGKLLAFVLLIGCAPSCMTVVATQEQWPEPYFYGGVEYDGLALVSGVVDFPVGHGGLFDGIVFGFIVPLIDLPFSLVGDTLLVPLHTGLWVRQRRECEVEEESVGRDSRVRQHPHTPHHQLRLPPIVPTP